MLQYLLNSLYSSHLTDITMPNWYYEKKDLKNTPSAQDGIDYEVEILYRREGARCIIDLGTKMGLRYDTMATGVVYFHRFYMFHSFKTFPRFVTACCCLFLAGKVEETPKKCKDIIKAAKDSLTSKHFSQFGDDPKEEVMTLERILLQTIRFDLQVDHAYGYLLKYAKCLKGDRDKLHKMVQMAWTFINDSLCTTLCLQWEPEVIAIALMYLAGKLSKFEVIDWNGRLSKQKHWWDMYVDEMSVELLEDICHQVLDLYSSTNADTSPDSPPQPKPKKKAVESLVSTLSHSKPQEAPPVKTEEVVEKVVAVPNKPTKRPHSPKPLIAEPIPVIQSIATVSVPTPSVKPPVSPAPVANIKVPFVGSYPPAGFQTTQMQPQPPPHFMPSAASANHGHPYGGQPPKVQPFVPSGYAASPPPPPPPPPQAFPPLPAEPPTNPYYQPQVPPPPPPPASYNASSLPMHSPHNPRLQHPHMQPQMSPQVMPPRHPPGMQPPPPYQDSYPPWSSSMPMNVPNMPKQFPPGSGHPHNSPYPRPGMMRPIPNSNHPLNTVNQSNFGYQHPPPGHNPPNSNVVNNPQLRLTGRY